jgi:glucoamylase
MGTRTKSTRVLPENLAPAAAAAAGAGAVLLGGAWAWSHFNQNGKPRQAPGHPGAEPRWYASAKSGVGTSVNSESYATSLVWFTIGHGILNEIFYPRVDWACTRDMGLIVTDGRDFFSTEEQHAEHRVEYPVEGVPLYRLINTCRQGRYRIETLIFANP